MNRKVENPRITLLRNSIVFQLKLLADGIRDAFLIPIAMIATIPGLVRGGKDADTEFNRVIEIGKRTERWINLFGNQKPLGFRNPAGSMDRVLSQVEAIVVEQYEKGKTAAETRRAVREALEKDDASDSASGGKAGQ